MNFPVVRWLLVFRHRICQFTASSNVQFLCFIILSAPFYHFTLGRPHRHLPSGDQVIFA